MEFLTNEKLTIVGAAGMIGSNMAQTAMMMNSLRIFVCMIRLLPLWKGWQKNCTTAASKVSTLLILLISKKR